jgi:hypothetical protein
MKNMTLTIVAALVAVAMLSAVLAVPMQEANAEKRDGKDGDKKDGKDGGNSLEINQKQKCERAFCTQFMDVDNDQSITEDGGAPDMNLQE